MYIQDAIASGRRFKRRCEEKFWEIQKDKDGLDYLYYDGVQEPLSIGWLTATDWELEEPRIEIRKEQLIKAVVRAFPYRLTENYAEELTNKIWLMLMNE